MLPSFSPAPSVSHHRCVRTGPAERGHPHGPSWHHKRARTSEIGSCRPMAGRARLEEVVIIWLRTRWNHQTLLMTRRGRQGLPATPTGERAWNSRPIRTPRCARRPGPSCPGGSFGNAGADLVIVEGSGGRGARRGGQGVRRLPARLRSDAHRSPASGGDRGGAQAARARHHLLRQQRSRHPACRSDLRSDAVCGEDTLHEQRLGGHTLCDAGDARVPRALEDPEVRGRLPRHERPMPS